MEKNKIERISLILSSSVSKKSITDYQIHFFVMTLSIIIVNWNGKELLKNCLNSILRNASGIALEVFVVDNGSEDGTPEMVKNEFPQVKLIVNDKNLGFAKANNQAMRQILESGAVHRDQTSAVTFVQLPEFVLLLNQDMEVLPETLKGMVDFMRAHPEAGVASCHLVNKEGKTVPHVRKLPTLLDQAAIILKLPHVFPYILDDYLRASFDYNAAEPQNVDSVRGSFFMIRRETLEKLGGFDERYFFWFEEVDYCRQVKNAGWRIMYNPSVKGIDLVGQSVKRMNGYQAQKMFLESMLKYFRKWEPEWQYWLLWLMCPIGLGMAWIADLMQNVKLKVKN